MVSNWSPSRLLLALTLLAALVTATPATASDLVLTGVVDGPLTGGVPKAIELCATADIADLSAYGIGSANNGGGSDGEEFTFPAISVSAGTFLYVASEAPNFETFFGFTPDFTSGAASINGDDAIELFMTAAVADVFGDINVDGTGQPWDYQDGWAYRVDGTGPDGSTFVLGNWTFSGANALDGEATNDGAATPFPIGSYSSCEPSVPVPDILLSELVVTPTAGEYVEIYNPTAAAVDLSDVYLTDATFAGGGVFYYNIVTGANAGGGGFGDFHARFPDGATIGAGGFQTIALAGSDDFFAEYGFDPDYELFEDGAGADAVPDMREALPGSINEQGGLSNSGEVVILYTWDGESDLVADIDYALWGDAAEAVDKTGVAIDGPDADATTSTYLADTTIALQDVISAGSHAGGDSFQRVDFAEGSEAQSGGNGLTGSDETSEDLSVTWQLAAATPGAGPPAPPAEWVINEIHADPDSSGGDANGDGTSQFSDDEFVEIVNDSGAAMDISGWTLADGFTERHTFPAGTVVPDGCSVVVFGGGSPTGAFGNSLVQVASTGALGLNNSGDTVTLSDGLNDRAAAGYGGEGGDNQSLTLDPDVTGVPPYVKHTVATGSGGTLYSPGTRIDGAQFSGCDELPAAWVINEIHADPDSSGGDANGDGTSQFSEDEFVEIVNNTGAAMDISGWTLADGFTLRHTFPAGTVVLDRCSVVVFGGGSPTGGFGNSLVQTASTGSLGLNNSGDTVTINDGVADVNAASYGGEGGDNQSLTLDPDLSVPPYVKHTVATGSGGALYSPGTRIDGSQFAGCPVVAEIYEIQGAGAASPFVGGLVITADNVVTALRDTGAGIDGFFMQTPAARADGDVDTSDGVFVFTGADPGVAVGDRVTVTGDVVEFFGFTEIVTDPSNVVTVGAGGLPAPVAFDATTPSGDPALPSCSLEFECYEGMLVEIVDGAVTGPNQRFNPDPVAEVYVTAAPARTFREPGVEFPGLMTPPIPTWDGNPEVFELDPDRLGLPNQIIPAGSSYSATGVVGFEFGGYELWPTELTVTAAPLPDAVRPRSAGEMTVGSLNLFRLFDDLDDPEDPPGSGRNDTVVSAVDYQRRLTKFSAYVRDVLDSPDILAVQEAEKLGVLVDLAARIQADDPSVAYSAWLVEGNDIGTIDVGFLTRQRIQVDAITQLGKDETFVNPVTGQDDILHDRPPLLLEGSCQLEFGSYPISAMVVHNRSLSRIEDPVQGVRVRVKRLRQAESIAEKVQALQDADPAVRLVVLGDFNAYEFTDGYADAVAVVAGSFDPTTSLVCSEAVCAGDLVEPDLTNQVLGLAPEERYSFIFRGNAQVLDHALTSAGLFEVTGAEYGRGNADAAIDLINDDVAVENLPLRSSDHDGLVVYVLKDEDDDGVPNDDDFCPATEIPEGVPTVRLGQNRYALVDGDRIFDIGDNDEDSDSDSDSAPPPVFTLGDTGGCSCEQIIVELGLGKGHEKFGCSRGAMEDWSDFVAGIPLDDEDSDSDSDSD